MKRCVWSDVLDEQQLVGESAFDLGDVACDFPRDELEAAALQQVALVVVLARREHAERHRRAEPARKRVREAEALCVITRGRSRMR